MTTSFYNSVGSRFCIFAAILVLCASNLYAQCSGPFCQLRQNRAAVQSYAPQYSYGGAYPTYQSYPTYPTYSYVSPPAISQPRASVVVPNTTVRTYRGAVSPQPRQFFWAPIRTYRYF